MGRRTLLRKALLTGAGAIVASAASISFADTAYAYGGTQADWAYCDQCAGLFFATTSFVNNGRCPISVQPIQHSRGSRNYYLEFGMGSSTTRQEGWRYCGNCKGLFWGNEQSTSFCPALMVGGGPHSFGSSRLYDVRFNEPSGQDEQLGWDFCGNCKGLYWGNGNHSNGVCPGTFGQHVPGSTRVYDMKF